MRRTATAVLGGTLIGLASLTACSTGGTATPAPATTSRPKPKPASLPTAANGTDLAVCAGGTCEVEVTGPVTIPTAPAFGVMSIAVTSIGGNDVGFQVIVPAGQFSSDCTDPNCDAEMTGPAAGGDSTTAVATPHTGATLTINNVAIKVEGVVGGAAVLRLGPA